MKRLEGEKIEREKLQTAVEVAGAVCHEMNQPLQAASGMSELLIENSSLGESSISKIKQIKDQIDRMGAVTKKLMKVTKYETKDYLDSKIIDLDKSAA
jgi:C4-dicarboxylate-specific signal transduction histidine kinase